MKLRMESEMQFGPALVVLLCLLLPGITFAAEVPSPERFMRDSYGWTINKIDDERGMFGSYRNFLCFDDRLSPPRDAEEGKNRRWGTQCQTKRYPGENLGAMIFVTWVNPDHSKPVTPQWFQQFVANQMANEKDNNAEPRCNLQSIDASGKPIELYDCSMILPFGTYFASILHFEHRGIGYYVRVANASDRPDAGAPKQALRAILKALSFSQ